MKENKEIMDKIIEKIGKLAIDCVENKKFSEIIIGAFVNKENENFVSIQFFYLEGSKYISLEENFWDNKETSELEEIYFNLQEEIFKLQEYCYSCGDEWENMTFKIDNNGKFNINFSYDKISILNWKEENKIEKTK